LRGRNWQQTNQPYRANQAGAITTTRKLRARCLLLRKIMKKKILDYTLEELTLEITDMGEAAYRAKQVFAWLHQKGASSFSEMANLPKELIKKMKETFEITTLLLAERKVSQDGETEKFLWELADGEYIETVLILARKRRTICVSTQVGCKFKCPFCASGADGFTRNLTSGEIVDQLLSAQRVSGGRLTNIVFMGMGEAMDNYDNVEKAIRIINHSDGINLGARKITVSTCGIVPGIKKLAEMKPHVELSVSLHSLDEQVRSRLVPANRRYPLRVLLPACRAYRDKTGRDVTIEYTLIKGVNDSAEDALKLGEAAREIKAKINLIACSQDGSNTFEAPEGPSIKRFRDIARAKGATVTVRSSKGGDIAAACGQLAGKKRRRTTSQQTRKKENTN
jgi:23S rRNA (adenine2503-C2)-methyltransferase